MRRRAFSLCESLVLVVAFLAFPAAADAISADKAVGADDSVSDGAASNELEPIQETSLAQNQPPAASVPTTQPDQPAAPAEQSPVPSQLFPQPLPPAPAVSALPAAPQDFLTGIFGQSTANASRRRLARVPDMFGDSIFPSATITGFDTFDISMFVGGPTDLLLGGGARRTKIAANNKALPVDRIYFNYNYFANATQFQGSQTLPLAAATSAGRSFSLHHYTLGVEKTFLDGNLSLELRMPFASSYQFVSPGPALGNGLDVHSGEIGNLGIILKALLYHDETFALAVGLGIETPTGSDARAQIGWTDYRLENEAVLLQPFVGILAVPDDCWFVHAFAQIDVAANGNTLHFSDATTLPGTPSSGTYGRLNDQTLLYLDISAGYWLYRNSSFAADLTGVAVIGEFHYTTTLQGGDSITGTRALPVGGVSTATVRSRGGEIDVINFTTGLHFELFHDTALRAAVAVPLRDSQNRFFDAELMLQLTRRF